MHVRKPIVRHFIACDEIEPSQDAAGLHYSLRRLIYRIRPLPGAAFPRVHPSLSLFVQLSDAQGVHEFFVEVVYWRRGEPTSLWKTRAVRRDLGSDPLQVHGWPIQLRNLLLPGPGDYDLVLWCDGSEAARSTICVEEAS